MVRSITTTLVHPRSGDYLPRQDQYLQVLLEGGGPSTSCLMSGFPPLAPKPHQRAPGAKKEFVL